VRALALYLRSRGVPAALAVSVPGMLAVAWAGTGHADPQRAVAAAVLAVGLGAAVLGHGLAGHDGVLDRTAAIRWAPRRVVHLAGIIAVVSVVVLSVTTIADGVVWRDAVALGGLAAVAAALFGRQLAWAPPVAVAGVSAMIPALPGPMSVRVLTWAAQPADSPTAAVAAALLAVLGLGVYVVLGPRPTLRT
jgi:hypothetical protein